MQEQSGFMWQIGCLVRLIVKFGWYRSSSVQLGWMMLTVLALNYDMDLAALVSEPHFDNVDL